MNTSAQIIVFAGFIFLTCININAQQFGSITDSRDGKVYKTVRIGTHWWMAENLNYYTPTGSAYYENDSAGYAQTYGRLYTWTAGNASCPAGWHMSTHNDWKKLENYMGISPDGYDAIELPHTTHPKMGTNQGGMLKKDTTLWLAPNTGATNITGFSAVPAGVRYGTDAGSFAGKFGDLGSDAHFWAGEYSSTTGYIRVLSTNNAQIEINDFDKSGYRSVRCVENEIPDTAKYLGQTPPGDKAVKFAPGIISQTDRLESSIVFSPDGKECYFSVFEWVNGVSFSKIYYKKLDSNGWTEQLEASFSVNQNVTLSGLSADGNKLYFSKNMPDENEDIWVVERNFGGWGEPQRLPSPINSDFSEIDYSETADGDVYISSNRSSKWEIYRIPPLSEDAENLGPIVNSNIGQMNPCIAPDGSYLIFSQLINGRPCLVISFNKGNDEWTVPVDMDRSGAGINILFQDSPTLSPDGKYLFFRPHSGSPTNVSDIYWVSTHIIDTLKKIALPTSVIDVPKTENLVSVFPNPCNDVFTITLATEPAKNATAGIYNVNGKMVLQQTLNNPSSTIDLSAYPAGLYILNVNTGTEIINKKIIKDLL